jgi:hypothetical protein
MTHDARATVEAHWKTANAQDWPAFAKLLHPALRYEVPQTREYISGGEGYLEMFRTWPGPWTAHVTHLVCEQGKAICVIDFVVGGETMTGLSIFEVSAGLICQVTDYWPAPYEPPPRHTAHMKRRSAP